ncbi:MAG: class I SAM-dependent methyltransferase [Bacteroidetes bacterium]|nr:class I SAM-dependent methyltransferase [Bacteroidota bacterium]
MITIGDFIDVYYKIQQRGLKFILSKFRFSSLKRTNSTFNETKIAASNWWHIPLVRKRWNLLLTGKENLEYEDFLVQRFFLNKTDLNMLSLGCGIGSHEPKFAKYSQFQKIIGLDLAPKLIQAAQENTEKLNLKNLQYIAGNLYEMEFHKEKFDVVYFHSSLHHFENIDFLLKHKIAPILKNDGLLIINEYVGPNRIQHHKEQITSCRRALSTIPDKLKKRLFSKNIKKTIYRPGVLRMYISDPSEAPESENILPSIHRYFNPVLEKAYGGNILMPVLKDISHHFLKDEEHINTTLKNLFDIEDSYLKNHHSDHLLGVYTLKQ